MWLRIRFDRLVSGATAGVIGNASGGVRGATIGAFLQEMVFDVLCHG